MDRMRHLGVFAGGVAFTLLVIYADKALGITSWGISKTTGVVK